jgi:hypothetical protein
MTRTLHRVAEVTASIRRWWVTTRPVSTEARATLDRRWDQLPESSKTPAQTNMADHAADGRSGAARRRVPW